MPWSVLYIHHSLISVCVAHTPVEDSVFILNMATQILRKRGHAVETATNGSAGLDRLEAVCGTAEDFDLVLCDFQMPVRWWWRILLQGDWKFPQLQLFL